MKMALRKTRQDAAARLWRWRRTIAGSKSFRKSQMRLRRVHLILSTHAPSTLSLSLSLSFSLSRTREHTLTQVAQSHDRGSKNVTLTCVTNFLGGGDFYPTCTNFFTKYVVLRIAHTSYDKLRSFASLVDHCLNFKGDLFSLLEEFIWSSMYRRVG